MKGMDHDPKAENWTRATNRYPGCTCPPWRYNPRYPAPTAPECPTHGSVKAGGHRRVEIGEKDAY